MAVIDSGLTGSSIRVRIDVLRLPPGHSVPGAFVEQLGRSLAALRDGGDVITSDAVAVAVADALSGTAEGVR